MKSISGVLLALLFVAGCSSEDQIKKVLKENPEILIEAVKAKPAEFIEALNEAVKVAQKGEAEKKEADERKQMEDAMNNPLVPTLRADETYRGGGKDSPIIVVEYSDFECPFCSRAFKTVQSLMEKYGNKLTFVYKHLPLSFHPNAMIAAEYYEAIRLQSAEKAFKFHDYVYENQRELRNGEKFLKDGAKKVGANMGQLEKDIKSEAVKKRIEEDMKEAEKFGMQGTPGFLVNGVPVKGAYPQSHFEDIITKLKEKGKINL